MATVEFLICIERDTRGHRVQQVVGGEGGRVSFHVVSRTIYYAVWNGL